MNWEQFCQLQFYLEPPESIFKLFILYKLSGFEHNMEWIMQNNEQKTKFTNKLEVISCSHFIIQ